MRFLLLLLSIILVITETKSQFVLDTTIHSDNYYNPTQEELKRVYDWTFFDNARRDTVKLRPNQYVSIMVDGGNVKITFDSVGIGSFRQAYYTVLYQKNDSLIFIENIYFPNFPYGRADCNGYVMHPSVNSITTNILWTYRIGRHLIELETIQIVGLGTNVRSHIRILRIENY